MAVRTAAAVAAGILLGTLVGCGSPSSVPTVTVTETVSPTAASPRPEVDVPNVVGTIRSSAESLLTNLGVAVLVVEVRSDIVPPGIVATQTPVAGSHVSPGSTVTISISAGQRR